ncbi:FadR/GntR family transcriptional regulator [Kitasatospora sp. NPDC057541]|uniref:FadR/GntR family transcriptional regulator n=1 Tax=unclassified Kitasatospora TaxID=2633591 RepID=UPI0036A596E8
MATPATHDLPGPRKGRTQRLAAALRTEITSGRWQSGEALPTGSDLATTYGVSAAVVSGAIGLLKNEKLLTGPAGGRTRVADTPAVPGQSELAELARQLRATLAADQRAELVRLLADTPPTAGMAAEDLARAAHALHQAVRADGTPDHNELAAQLQKAFTELVAVMKSAVAPAGHPAGAWWERAHQDAQALVVDLANTLPPSSR